MEQQCIRHTELPGATRLFSDLVYAFDRVSRFYGHAPYDPDAYAAAAAEIRYPDERRAAVAAALRELNPGNPSVDAFAAPGTVAVITGQQVGLFGGPLYTLYKALAAVKLARTLSARGVPAVPLFWLATEDHDLDEVNQSWVFDAGHVPHALTTSATNPAGGPVGPIPLRDIPIDALRRHLQGLPFAAEALAMAEASYQEGRPMGAAFRALVEPLLAPYGMLFADPLAPALRAAAAPMLASALSQSKELVRSVQERSRELEAAGYHAQVHLEPNASLFFLLENGRRTPLRRTERGFNEYSAGQLEARAPDLSPNALLRPVMQDYLFPTVAYLGGPAELAYFAQSQPLYQQLLGRMPVVAHRASFTLLDHKAGKLAARYGLTLPAIAVPEAQLRERVAAALVPETLRTGFAAARERVSGELEQLAGAVRASDPGLEKAIATSQAKMLHQMTKLERKAAREALRRDERAASAASYLGHALYPHRHLQERFYGLLPMLAKHGPELAARVYEHVHPECPDHQVLALD